jgi:hypothetical protein
MVLCLKLYHDQEYDVLQYGLRFAAINVSAVNHESGFSPFKWPCGGIVVFGLKIEKFKKNEK